MERAASIASVIEIFSFVPRRVAAAGIYEFCEGLKEIGRERQGKVFETFGVLRHRFDDKRYYKELPDDTRVLYVSGALFARGAFAIMRDDAHVALECADALDACGLRIYSMIASQIRFLLHANRGELDKAAAHREQVELHAARIGSVWQVETWEHPCLIPLYVRLDDVVGLKLAVDRLVFLSQTIPSLKRYARLARLALSHVQGESIDDSARVVQKEVGDAEPRSFIGWSSSAAFMARAYNRVGRYSDARDACELVLPHVTEADRDYVMIFLDADLEMVIAEAGLGNFDRAVTRIDGLLARFKESDNPLVQGKLHETRARVAIMAGRMDEYRHHLSLADHWFRGTGTPALVAAAERLAALATFDRGSGTRRPGLPREPRCTGPTRRRRAPRPIVKTVVSKKQSA